MRFLKLFLVGMLIVTFVHTSKLFALCVPNDIGGMSILARMCWECIFPLRIGGIPVMPGPMPDSQNTVYEPICTCPFPPPVFERIGIPIGFFDPDHIIEVVHSAWCFPTMGFGMPTTGGLLSGTTHGQITSKSTFAQAHYLNFPVMSILDIFTDVACLTDQGISIPYISEVDPMWQNDVLAAFIQPEALLFGNPVTNLACIADSISSTVDVPLDPLFWCMGSWGNVYPLTGHEPTSGSLVQSSAGIAAKLLYKLHRELLVWERSGIFALCGKYPLPIWKKSDYRLQIVEPIPSILAMGIGQTSLIWGVAKNPPMIGNNFGFLLFTKIDCCMF